MTTSPQPAAPGGAAAGLGASGLQFLLPESRTNMGAVMGGAGASWSMILLGLALVFWLRPYQQMAGVLPDLRVTTNTPIYVPEAMVKLAGGGSGGGNKSPAPPRTAESPKMQPAEAVIPVATAEPVNLPEPELAIEVPVAAQGTVVALLGPNTNTPSLGPGDGRSVGPGKRGDGPGDGRQGSGGDDVGIANRVFDIGNGVSPPTLLQPAKPAYTSEGMIQRKEGTVRLSCVVSKTGAVDACEIVTSLDRNTLGLDAEAVKAARQFRFAPARRQGEPVAVRVLIEIAFNIR